MSTFKNVPVYAEAILGWCEVATYDDVPFAVPDVLSTIVWNFKGGQLGAYSHATHLYNESSETRFPSGMSTSIARQWPDGADATSLMQILMRRRRSKTMKRNVLAAWTATFASAVTLSKRARAEACGNGTVRTGLNGVYALLRHMDPTIRPHVTKGSWPKTREYIREMAVAAAGASFLHADSARSVTTAVLSALDALHFGDYLHLLDGVTGLLHAARSVAARQRTQMLGLQMMDRWTSASNLAGDLLMTSVHAVCDVRFHVLFGAVLVTLPTGVIVLSPSDISRVYQAVMNWCSGLFSVVAQACTTPGPERQKAVELGSLYSAQVSRMIGWSAMVPAGEEVHICKNTKRAFGAFLGELAGPLCAAETEVLWAEAKSGKFASRMELETYVSVLRGLSASMAFNIGKVYKLCPPPDSSPGTALMERHEMVINANTVDPAAMVEFEQELLANILRAAARTPGCTLLPRDAENPPVWYAALVEGKYDRVPSREMADALIWEGAATFPRRSPHNPSVWKDSGLGWDSFEMLDSSRRDRRFGNMLTRMVFDPDCPMPGTNRFADIHDHKADIKAEGHKDPARVFYVGNIQDRLMQSEDELAIESVAKYHPSFMIGASVELKEDRIRAIVDRPTDPLMVDVFYSFDVAGWSPRMAKEPQRISHRLWGVLFGNPSFAQLHTVNEDARIYIDKNGYRAWYRNPSANLEGYNGKEMTMVLIALLSLSVRRWRVRVVELGLATADETLRWAALLLAYIDDGLAKLRLPQDRAVVLFSLFKVVTVETFAECGYTIEISKCYPSDRFSIFLNEIYLGGRHVVHGTRAAMTICAENVEAHTTLVERAEAVSAGCRGSVMAGLDPFAATLLQAYHVHRHFRDWTRERDPTILALWSMAPRSFGGLGLPATLQLATSGGGSATEESVRTLKIWSTTNATVRRFLITCLRTPMKQRTPAAVLAAPLGLSIGSGEMTTSRVPEYVREALNSLAAKGGLSRLASEFLAYSSFEAFNAFATAIVPLNTTDIIQEQVLRDAAEAHPHAIFTRFTRRLEMSSTLSAIVGSIALKKIIADNRRDAAASIALIRTRSGL